MSQVVTAVLLIFSGVTFISAQPFFGAPGFDGFARGPFSDFGPRTFGVGGDFGPPTVRRLGGRFPDFGADFGGAVRGGGPLLGTIDGPRFGFNGDNTLGLDRVTGPRLDGLRGGRFGFDDTTFGTGFGRRVGGVGARRLIPGERLGGAFGAGNAIAPRRLGTTRTITRGNALDVPRSTVLGGLGTDTTGLFMDPVTGRRVRVLTNNDASTVVSRRAAAAAAGGPTRTGSLTPRRADATVTATRTRLPTTLTQRGTLLRRQMAGGRRTPITRIAGTTMARPGTLTGTAGTGLTVLNNIRGGMGTFPRPFLPFDNIEGRPMIPLNALDGAGARSTTGLSGINSNRLTFDSVDLSAFGTGQSGFVQGADPTGQLTGLGNGLVLARPPATGVSLGLGRQGVRLPLDEAARRALSVTNRRPSVSQTGMATGRVAGVTRRAIPGTVANGRGLTGATSRNRVTVIRAGGSPVVGSSTLRGSAGTGVSGTTVRRTISTQGRRMPGTSNLVATRQRGFVLDNTTRQRQGSGGVTASASNVRRVSTASRRVPSSGARRQVSRTSSATMTLGTVGGSTNVPANIDLNNVPALDLSMASGSSSSSSSASSSSSSTSSTSGSTSTTARKTQTSVVESIGGVSSGTTGQNTRTTITRTTTVTGPDGSASRDLTSLEKQLMGAADADRPVFAIIPMNDRANSADLQNIMENIATSMNTMTSTVSPILPSMTDLETSNTISDTTKRSNPPDPLAP